MVRNEEELQTIVEHRKYLRGVNSSIFFAQEYVKKPGRDIRVLVVGDEVPVAVHRVGNHWITNTARDSVAVKVEVDEELRGREILGIDVFEDPGS